MEYKFFIGIDVSKETLDVCLIEYNFPDVFKYLQIVNSSSGMKELFKWLKKMEAFTTSESVFCMEYTGIYNHHATEFLLSQSANIWMENAVHIKRSIGLQRGKNDKVDAKRIAEYALLNVRQVRLWEPSREVLNKIRQLGNLRDNMIDTKSRLENPIK
jgi:transposase